MLIACNQNGMALRFASCALQNDRELAMVAAASCYKLSLTFPFDTLPCCCKRTEFGGDGVVACVAEALALRSVFFNLFLRGVSVRRKDASALSPGAMPPPSWPPRLPHLAHSSSAAQAPQHRFSSIPDHQAVYRLGAAAKAGGAEVPERRLDQSSGGKRCLLPLLDIGGEDPIKKLIADFLGVPYGASWHAVQLAAAHLSPFLCNSYCNT